MKFVLIIGLILLAGLSFSGCATVDHSVRIDTDGTNSFTVGQYRDVRSDLYGPRRLGEGDPVKFARAVAMINYSKNLKSIKYNECGGLVAYEFEQRPVSSIKPTYQAPGARMNLPSSFGHQPVE
jgi:hypothetical protein